jgi:hypothetical protein
MGSLSAFKQFKESVAEQDWEQAAWDLGHKSRDANSKASKYARQTGNRARTNITTLKNLAKPPTTQP